MGVGATIVVIVAIIYGITLAVLPMQRWSTERRRACTLGGAGVVAVVAVLAFAIPW